VIPRVVREIVVNDSCVLMPASARRPNLGERG
jgi:hypothetical protein